jgi:hypothetical protein
VDLAKVKEYFLNSMKGGVCDVLVVRKNSMDWKPSQPCHACMRTIYGKDIEYVFSSLRVHDEKNRDTAEEYFDFILHPEKSPFRAALEGVERVYDANGKSIAFGVKNNGVANQICVGVMIQARVPSEWPKRLEAFKDFRTEGFTAGEAMFLSEHFYSDGGGYYGTNDSNGAWHSAIAPEYGFSYKIFKDATFKGLKTGNAWNKGVGTYAEIYPMWRDKNEPSKIFSLVIEEGEASYRGFFPNAFLKERNSLNFDKHKDGSSTKLASIVKLKDIDREKWG